MKLIQTSDSVQRGKSDNTGRTLHQLDEMVSIIRLALEDLLDITSELRNLVADEEDEEFVGEDLAEEYEDYEYEDHGERGWSEDLPHGYEEIEYPQDDQTIYDPEQRETERAWRVDLYDDFQC